MVAQTAGGVRRNRTCSIDGGFRSAAGWRPDFLDFCGRGGGSLARPRGPDDDHNDLYVRADRLDSLRHFVTLAIVRREASAVFWAAIVAGVAMETKYGIGVWLLGLGLGLMLTGARAIFARRGFWSAAALAD